MAEHLTETNYREWSKFKSVWTGSDFFGSVKKITLKANTPYYDNDGFVAINHSVGKNADKRFKILGVLDTEWTDWFPVAVRNAIQPMAPDENHVVCRGVECQNALDIWILKRIPLTRV